MHQPSYIALKSGDALYDLDAFSFNNDFRKLSVNMLQKCGIINAGGRHVDDNSIREQIILKQPRLVIVNTSYILYKYITTPFNLGYAYLCKPLIKDLPSKIEHVKMPLSYATSDKVSLSLLNFYSMLMDNGVSLISRSVGAVELSNKSLVTVDNNDVVVPKTGRVFIKPKLGLSYKNTFYKVLNTKLSLIDVVSSKISSLKANPSNIYLAYQFDMELKVPTDAVEELKITDFKSKGDVSVVMAYVSPVMVTDINASQIIGNTAFERSVRCIMQHILELGYSTYMQTIDMLLQKQITMLHNVQ